MRYISQDHANKSAKATQLIESYSAENQAFIKLISFVELVWAIQDCYKVTKDECIAILQTVIHTREILLEMQE